MLNGVSVPIIVIGFRTPGDISDCLTALSRSNPSPTFGVFVCENGGAAAFDALVAALSAENGPCAGSAAAESIATALFPRVRQMALTGGQPVIVAQASENLGYAGGINVCIEALVGIPDWKGIWVLNPDTVPEPDALPEMVDFAEQNGKGMVGSRLMYTDNPNIVRTRGLKWRKWAASTVGVDNFAPLLPAPDPADVERRIDSPSGASFYLTRSCLDRIGPMDDRYFVYYEDLDWGMRAKASCGIGYAYNSVVPHLGGASMGSAQTRAARSHLSVYLDFRNRLLFVRRHYSRWYLWTIGIGFARAFEYLVVGAFGNFQFAIKGTLAGLRGEVGRPDHIMARTVDSGRTGS